MASSLTSFSFSCLIVLISLFSPNLAATAPFKPSALLLTVTKDTATNQYVTVLQQRTPPVPVRLVVDLGSRYTWIDCSKNYISSTFNPVSCKSPLCSPSKFFSCGNCTNGKPRPGCNMNTCGGFATNPYIHTSTGGEISQDAVVLPATNGKNPLNVPVIFSKVAFECVSGVDLLANLSAGTVGMAAFGRTKLALPAQVSSSLHIPNKFAVCLPSSATNGVIFFGDLPEYRFLLNKVITPKSLLYAPLLTNPVSTAGVFVSHEPSYEYFIDVRGIKVGGKVVKAVNTTLLSIVKNTGQGGTKISTVDPYTVLETSIYKAVANAFTKASGLNKVAPVAPFSTCYDARNVSSTRVGPGVPTIELVIPGSTTTGWIFWGANSMVSVRPGVLCLGFVDGGAEPRTSIVVGGHQLEDNFLLFDLVGKRVGISGSLLFSQTTCSNFNFTVAAP